MPNKPVEDLIRTCRSAKQPIDNQITITSQEPVNYEKFVRSFGEEVIKFGNTTICHKYSIGDTLETIESYEGEDCPPECGTVTNIIENYGDVLYEIDNKILIYEEWLRLV